MKNVLLFFALITISCTSCKTESKTEPSTDQEVAKIPLQSIFIGSYPQNPDQGIYTATFDPNTGDITNLQVAATAENPSYLTLSADRSKLYAVNELNGKPGLVSSFTIDKRTMRLYPVDTVSALGIAPCYISLNKDGNVALVANYSTGDIIKVSIDEKGNFGNDSNYVSHETEQSKSAGKNPHAHSIAYHPELPLIFAADLGLDVVKVYSQNLEEIGEIKTASGAGPRHFTFNADGSILYIINELNSTIDVVNILSENQFDHSQTISTLPPDFEGESFSADIHLHPSGKYLLGSNRGHDSIVVLEVLEDGTLENPRWITEAIAWPRNFAVSPDGNWVLVANQKGASITSYRFFNEGEKDLPAASVEVHAPVCIKFY